MPRPTIVPLAFDLTDDRDRQDFIQVMMRRQGITIQDIASEIGVVRTLVSTVISGQKKSTRVRSGVAELLGIDADILWAEPDEKEAKMT